MANINILLNEFQKDLHLSISDNTHIKVKIWIIEKYKRQKDSENSENQI